MNSPHGKCLVSVKDDIIYIMAAGSFNKEGITKSIQDIQSAIETFDDRGFKLLIDFTDIEGGTPKAFVKINEFNLWLNHQKLIAKAVVFSLAMTLPLLDSRAPARKLQNNKGFENKISAIEWLNLQ